ncbi:2OG-Fe(II) oxygenase superfamily domain-containing protein [Phthorimaea operculella]|nr:2OG-Fe(II) oxygenase superfamily domain-containing protein [Phthorimaea operculella]
MEDIKKGDRKKKRFAARLKSSRGIICTDEHGPNIVLCNAGQATGLEKPDIERIITQTGLDISIRKFIAEKGESHSFLVFKDNVDATKFYSACNGVAKVDENGPPLYMSFVENVPNTEVICEYDNPKDLTILEDFITQDEEKQLIALFDWVDDSSNLKNRQVKHYGYEFRYGSNDVDLSTPLAEKIPEQCDVLWRRLREKGFDLGVPDQLTVNKYEPGQGIPSHVDKHSPFGPTILSVSLGSSVVMDWKHHSGKYVPVVVPARSMLVMQGEARYDWQHGIQPRTWDPIIESRASDTQAQPIKVITSETEPRGTRISLTFRWTRSGPCDCKYKTLCDSSVKGSEDIEDCVASNLEELHVHQVYEQIAGHFSSTRHKPWPKVVEFMENVPPGAIVLDLGCGNGKNILRRGDIWQVAGERSSGLLSECKQHIQDIPYADCVRLDLLHTGLRGGCADVIICIAVIHHFSSKHVQDIPYADCVRLDLLQTGLRGGCADVIICIAVIHHFSSKVRRLQSIENISRLLRPGGRALVTVWAKDQTKSNYLLKNKTPQTNDEIVSVGGVTLPVHENRTQFKHNDLLVPWKLRTKNENKLSDKPESTLLRYYHVFEENELESLCKEVPGLEVENSFYEEGNWCVVFKKIQ